MGLPLFILFIISCNKQSITESEFLNQKTEIRASICDDPNRCPPGDIQIITKPYTINGCVITGTYKVAYCADLLTISELSYSFANSAACNSIKQIWNQYYFNGQSELANEAVNEFYNEITLLIEADIISGLSLFSPPPIIEWIETKCHKLCANVIRNEEGDVSFIELSQVPCGNGC